MAGNPIGIDIHVYGTYARASALADWMELACLGKHRVTRSTLADLISDNNWTRLKTRQFSLHEQHQAELPPEGWADAVFAILEERSAILAERWPFEIRNDNFLSLTGSTVHCPYVSLLCLTVAHAWKVVGVMGRPEYILEDIVRRALARRGARTAGMGATERRGMAFKEALRAGAQSVGLRPSDNPTPLKASVKDAGVDTLVMHGWDDARPGQWIKIGQVTIGSSDTWEKKAGEPRSDHWRSYLNELLTPETFLAVSHHIQRDHMHHMTGPQRGLVVDRLRLCLDLDEITDPEEALIDAVLVLGTEDGRAASSVVRS